LEAHHSSFSERIFAKIVAAEPAKANAVLMTCQDEISKKRKNDCNILSAKTNASKLLSKHPLCKKTKQNVLALTSLAFLSYSSW
jgi:hypothetical protein